jgi:hypothetical protein
LVVYDDALELVQTLLPDLLKSVHHTLVLVSAEPWHGQARDASPALKLLGKFLGDPQLATRLSVRKEDDGCDDDDDGVGRGG